jgi:hypothetical protein
VVDVRDHLLAAAAALRADRPKVVGDWLDRYERSLLRLPGTADRDGLCVMGEPVVDALVEVLNTAEQRPDLELRPGAPALRETEKQLSFLGAALSGVGVSGFDAFALVCALRDALAASAGGNRQPIDRLFDWFGALLMDGFAQARGSAAAERHREELESNTPVVAVLPDVPAAFLIGSAVVHGVDSVLARLVLLVVRLGARVAIIDASGLRDAGAPRLREAISRFCSHKRILGRISLVVVGLTDDQSRDWTHLARDHQVDLHAVETFPQAMTLALKFSEYMQVVKDRPQKPG